MDVAKNPPTKTRRDRYVRCYRAHVCNVPTLQNRPTSLNSFTNARFWQKSRRMQCVPNPTAQNNPILRPNQRAPKPNMSRLTKPFIKDVQQNVSYRNFKHSSANKLGCPAYVFCRWRSCDSSQCIRRSIVLADPMGIPRPSSTSNLFKHNV